jgi:hypothetical protein
VVSAIAETAPGAFTGFGTDSIGRLRFKKLLHGLMYDLA